MKILPRIKCRAAACGGAGDHEGFACYEFTQNVGETIFIPHGWWHAVLNLTDTVGITQNYCSQRNFDEVWIRTRTGRKKMAYNWLCKLNVHYPHLAKRAESLNKRDDFVMKYDPIEVHKRERDEQQKKKLRENKRRGKLEMKQPKNVKKKVSKRRETRTAPNSAPLGFSARGAVLRAELFLPDLKFSITRKYTNQS